MPQIEMFYSSGNNRSDGKACVHHIRGVVCVGECGHASDELGGQMDTITGYRRRRGIRGCLGFLCGGFRRHVGVRSADQLVMDDQLMTKPKVGIGL